MCTYWPLLILSISTPCFNQPPICFWYPWTNFVCLFYFILFHWGSKYKWSHIAFIFFFVWLISFSMMPSRSIHSIAYSRISFFLWLSNIFIHLSVGSCDQCCTEHGSTGVSLISCFHFPWVYTQTWDCWVVRWFFFLIFWGISVLFSMVAVPIYSRGTCFEQPYCCCVFLHSGLDTLEQTQPLSFSLKKCLQ